MGRFVENLKAIFIMWYQNHIMKISGAAGDNDKDPLLRNDELSIMASLSGTDFLC